MAHTFLFRVGTTSVQWLAALCAATLLAGCGSWGGSKKPTEKPLTVQEQFGSSATYSRMFDATPQQTCEAARRALLSQGYIVNKADKEMVEGQKSFQPQSDRHVQMNIRVTCVNDSSDGRLSTGFVTALQDNFALKMASSSASVGVSMLGSVSVPLSAGHDSMIKIGSETITNGSFYDSFFDLMRRYLMVEPEASVPAAARAQ